LRKAILTAATFAFAISLGEFGATLVLQNPDYATLPIAIFDRLGRPGPSNYGAAMALSFILMMAAFGVMIILEKLES
jgi:thiamine transport system permease protein